MILQGEQLRFWENSFTTFKSPNLENVHSYRIHILTLPLLVDDKTVQQKVICLGEQCPICNSLKKLPTTGKLDFSLPYPTNKIDMYVYDFNDELKVLTMNRKFFWTFSNIVAEKKNPLKFRYAIIKSNLHGYPQYGVERAGKLQKEERLAPNTDVLFNEMPTISDVEIKWMSSVQYHNILADLKK